MLVLTPAHHSPSADASALRASAPCQVIGFSPKFAQDGTALCAYESASATALFTYRLGPVQVYLTTDRGRSWRHQAGLGLPGNRTQDFWSLQQVIFSPLFAADHSVYLAASGQGIFRSTDLGATWTGVGMPTATTVNEAPPLAPIMVTGPNLGEGQGTKVAAFLYAGGTGSVSGDPAPEHWANVGADSLLEWPGYSPVAGTQNDQAFDRQFVATPDWPRSPLFVLSQNHDLASQSNNVQVHACTPAFLCTTLLVTRSRSWTGRLVVSPTYSRDSTIWLLYGAQHPQAVAVSTDGGQHWREWQGLARMPERAGYISGFSVNPGSSRIITVRFTGLTTTYDAEVARYDDHQQDLAHKNAPGERVYRTTDGGAHWSLVSFAPNVGGKSSSRPATTSWNAPYGNYGSDTGGVWDFGGHLFTLAMRESRDSTGHWSQSYAGVWCSTDHGDHWTPTCTR